MTSKSFRVRSCVYAVAILFVIASIFELEVEARRKVNVPGRRVIVFDERLSALRTKPDAKSPLEQRLRRGRIVGVLTGTKNREGERYLLVAISRNKRGWVLADAVGRKASARDAERLMRLIEETGDDFTKARLARLCADEFPGTLSAARSLLILGEAGERAAARLTRDARRRPELEADGDPTKRRAYFLNFAGLDRYNRAGITFDYNRDQDRIVYDGAAYRELLRRYPRSAEARHYRERG